MVKQQEQNPSITPKKSNRIQKLYSIQNLRFSHFYDLIKKYKVNYLLLFVVIVITLAFLYKRLIYVMILRSVTTEPVQESQQANFIDWRLRALTVTPSPSLKQRIGIVPEYQSGEYLKFVNYTQGYEIQYPASNEDIEMGASLVGATAGNFHYKFNGTDGATDFYLDWESEPDQSLDSISLENIENITVPDFGGPRKIIYPEEKLIRKEQTTIDSVNAYRVITHIKDEVIERTIVPRSEDMFVFLVGYKLNKNPEADKTIKTFKFIPQVPQNWNEYADSKIKAMKFKYPPEYSVTASDNNDGTHVITLASDKGNIVFYFYGKDSDIGRLFGDYYGYTLESAIKAETLLKENIKDSKFSTNAFSFAQGGEYAVRVVHPYSQNLNVYFYIMGDISRIRVNVPLALEGTLNQILKSLSDYIVKYD